MYIKKEKLYEKVLVKVKALFEWLVNIEQKSEVPKMAKSNQLEVQKELQTLKLKRKHIRVVLRKKCRSHSSQSCFKEKYEMEMLAPS